VCDDKISIARAYPPEVVSAGLDDEDSWSCSLRYSDQLEKSNFALILALQLRRNRPEEATMTEDEAAVIEAAKRWVEAKEKILAEDETQKRLPGNGANALDDADSQLTEAVYRLIARGPRP
jgi:hypothetical protein